MNGLNPSFLIGKGEVFDITISNQSHFFEEALKCESIAAIHSDHPTEMANTVMKQLPLKDQGLILMVGPLRCGATSYPAQEVFNGDDFPPETPETGFGLLFRVEARQVVVQFGNGVHRFDFDQLRNYKLHATELPSPPELVTVDGK